MPLPIVDNQSGKFTVLTDHTSDSLATDAASKNRPRRASNVVPGSLVVRDVIEISRQKSLDVTGL